MDIKLLAKTIGKHAPLLGGLVAGGYGEKVGGLIASALGVENDRNAIEDAIKNDPQAGLKLREFELSNEQHLREMSFKTLDAELKDKQSARESHKHNPMPALICVALTIMVAGAAYMLFTVNIPDQNKEIAYLLFGSLLTKWGDSIAYWVGTTRSSAEKDRRKI